MGYYCCCLWASTVAVCGLVLLLSVGYYCCCLWASTVAVCGLLLLLSVGFYLLPFILSTFSVLTMYWIDLKEVLWVSASDLKPQSLFWVFVTVSCLDLHYRDTASAVLWYCCMVTRFLAQWYIVVYVEHLNKHLLPGKLWGKAAVLGEDGQPVVGGRLPVQHLIGADRTYKHKQYTH